MTIQTREIVCAVQAVLAAPAYAAHARIIYLDSNARGPNDGSSWLDAYKYPQDALADAGSSPKTIEIRIEATS